MHFNFNFLWLSLLKNKFDRIIACNNRSLLARGSPVPASSARVKIGFGVMASRYSLEPVGSKAPAFAGEAKISLLARKANAEVSLPCNAQGHPPPVTRYDI